MPDPSSLPGRDELRLLTEIGFLASGAGDVARAEIIFGALLLLRPERAFAHVGLATALMNAGRAADAVTHLASARIPPGEDADMVGAIYAIALQLAGRPNQSQAVSRKLADQPDGPEGPTDGKKLALQMLGENNVAKG
ncbi:MAG: hypothetical protein I8H77_14460 [Comamonadaceae bacterium]|nr:hypothetical protein [Comamonadaceae bacterium]